MKKIINAIVTALILSVSLTLFNPRWLFRNDAFWTYQNDAARFDVSFSGHLKHGRVGATGTNLRVKQPAWLSNGNYQGTCVEMPVFYRTKSYQIKLTPQADEWGTDAALVIKFMGRDFQRERQRKPAWVCFRNISLNGQPVAAEKVVWHNKPFVLKYPHHGSEITLTFEVSKPLAASDISYVYLIVAFLIFLLLSLFFSKFRQITNHAMFINGKIIANALKRSYAHIDPVHRRSFWIILGVVCCAFGLHAIWFMWGNHDWSLLQTNHRWSERAKQGRYMVYTVKVLLSNGVYLPLLYDIVTFVTLALNAVLLCKYWRLERRVIYYVLCGLVLVAQPFTLSMMYFVHMIPEAFIGVTCALVGLLLSEKIALIDGSTIKKIVYSFIAIVLINFALAMYPVLINTIAVAFVGRLLVQTLDWDGSLRRLKSCLSLLIISATNVLLGVALYKLIYTFFFPMDCAYNTETLPLGQVPERLGVLVKQSFRQLYEYNMAFLPQWTLWVFMGLTMILILNICCTGNLKQKVVKLILLFGSLFATQSAMVIAKMHLIDGRVELFGLVFFEVLVMVLFITTFRRLHYFSVIAGISVIFASIINDLDCLRVWKHGFDAEKMLWNRVLARLEIQKDFDPARKYDVVQIGESISLRSRYYTKSRENAGGLFMLREAYDFTLNIFSAHQFYYPTNFRRMIFPSVSSSILGRKGYEARLKRLYQAGVLQKAEVWPKPNGLIVWKDIILFVTDGKVLNNVKKQFEREQRGKRGE